MLKILDKIRGGGYLVLGVLFNLAVIFVFKYYDFFIHNVNSIFKTNFFSLNILLPLGISFYTFQQISYIVDAYYGEHKGDSLIDYALFVSFFPQLVAGPIAYRNEILDAINNPVMRKINYENMAKGIYLFAVGLFKKVFFADTLGALVNFGFEDISLLSSLEALLVMFAYSFQIYFDFSGYSDMAIGIGNMFNINLPQNFNSPYKATSIVDFWTRWHITLTRFLRKYLYFKLGGSRRGSVRTYINIMIVFCISGIWHGAAWGFIAWGLLHGFFNVIERFCKKHFANFLCKIPVFVKRLYAFLLVTFLWVFFRAEWITDAFSFFKQLFTCKSFAVREEVWDFFFIPEIDFLRDYFWTRLEKEFPSNMLCVPCIAFLLAIFVIVFFAKNIHQRQFVANKRNAIFTTALFCYTVISFVGVSTFIYFNF